MNGGAISCWFGVLVCTVISASADVSSQDITGPSAYYFTSEVYYSTATESAAAITVSFTPGNRGWTGSVAFETEEVTAVAGVDYTNVAGVLEFSGPAWQTFEVPLSPAPHDADKTVRLRLRQTEPDSLLTQAEAMLIIRAAPPALAMSPDANNTVRLSWPATYTNYVVQTTTVSGLATGEWSDISTAPQQADGQCVLEFDSGGEPRFFRLRRNE